jgi:hypothetical protein
VNQRTQSWQTGGGRECGDGGSRSGHGLRPRGCGHVPGPGNGHAHGLQTRDLHTSEDENSENSGSKKRGRDSNNDDNSNTAGKSQEKDDEGGR